MEKSGFFNPGFQVWVRKSIDSGQRVGKDLGNKFYQGLVQSAKEFQGFGGFVQNVTI